MPDATQAPTSKDPSSETPILAENNPPAMPGPNEISLSAFGDLAPEDFYFDGPYLVFTAAYHLKRGSCCSSGCRHCPWRESERVTTDHARS